MKTTRYQAVCGVFSVLLLTGCQTMQSGPSKRSMTETPVALTAETRNQMTPIQVLQSLKDGNARFASGKGTSYDYLAQAKATAAGQYPKALVLSCLDSRVPTEVVFDQGIGDIFVGRVAGNIEDTALLGSMEFATAAAGAKVIVVLGHTACGAVKGAVDNVALGNLTELLEEIKPAVRAVEATGRKTQIGSKDTAFVEAVSVENVRQTMKDLIARSDVLKQLVADGKLIIAGGIYDLETGTVTWLD